MDQVMVRQKLATFLLVKGLNLEAQIYILASIKLAHTLPLHPSQKGEVLQNAEKILAKINRKPMEVETKTPLENKESNILETKNSENNSSCSFSSQALLVSSTSHSQPNSLSTLRQLESTVAEEIPRNFFAVTLSPSKDLVEYKLSKEAVERYYAASHKKKVEGWATEAVGFLSSGIVYKTAIGTRTWSFIASAAHASSYTGLLRPVGLASTLCIAASASFYLGDSRRKRLCEEGESIYTSTTEAEELTKNIELAVSRYENGRFQEFLSILEKNISADKSKEIRILKLHLDSQRVIDCTETINMLIRYGFRPDGIAYLLNLIVQVLVSTQIESIATHSARINAATLILENLTNSTQLRDFAKAIDEQLKDKQATENPVTSFKYPQSAYQVYSYGGETHGAVRELPINDRLKVMLGIAKVNLALLLLTEIKEDDIHHKTALIEKIKELVNSAVILLGSVATNDEGELAKSRLEVIQNLMEVFGYTMPQKKEEVPYLITDHHSLRLQKIMDSALHTRGLEDYSLFPVHPGEESLFESLQKSLVCQGHNQVDITRKQMIAKAISCMQSDNVIRNIFKKYFGFDQRRQLNHEEWYSLLLRESQDNPEACLQLIVHLWDIEIHLLALEEKDQHVLVREKVNYKFASRSSEIRPIAYIAKVTLDEKKQHFIGMELLRNAELVKVNKKIIQQGNDPSAKLESLKQRGNIYCNMAKNAFKTQGGLAASKWWSLAAKDYEEAAKNPMLLLEFYENYVETLVALSRYQEANIVLDSLSGKAIKNPGRYFYLRGIINVKIGDVSSLSRAERNINVANQLYTKEGTFLDENKNEIERAKAWIHQKKMRIAKSRDQRLEKYRTSEVKDVTRISNTATDYNILSIDGGGVRGIIPGLVLAEIEKQTKRPISTLFDLVAGTSTGSILAAGLNVPAADAPSVPRHRAIDLVGLYTQKADRIFARSWTKFHSYFMPLYKAESLENLLKEYLEPGRLSTTLTNVLVTSLDTQKSDKVHIFDSRSAKYGENPDYALWQVCRASAAAPTYLPPFSLGSHKFVDGGVIANNPAMLAYTYATTQIKINSSQIYLLSLGTGYFAPDPVSPNKYSGKLYWATNLHQVALNAQEEEMHSHLVAGLGASNNRYHRFQPNLHRLISLDGVSEEEINALIDVGEEMIEEDYASENSRLRFITEKFLLKEEKETYTDETKTEEKLNKSNAHTPSATSIPCSNSHSRLNKSATVITPKVPQNHAGDWPYGLDNENEMPLYAIHPAQ